MNKREFLLKELEKFEIFLQNWDKTNFNDKNTFLRIRRNFLRFIYSPFTTLSFLMFRLFPIKKKIKVLNSRSIVLKGGNASTSMLYFGFIRDKIELKLTKFLIKNLSSEDVFYDIGANFGFYTYLALEFCKEVHVFEPLEECIHSLKMNLQNVNNVFLNECALSDKEGLINIYIPKKLYGLSTIKSNLLTSKDITIREVFSTTLDKYIYEQKHTPPTFVKIDVEGAEFEILTGATKFLNENSPIISLEVWSKTNNGELSMKAVNFLRNLGYKSYFIKDDGELEYMDGDLTVKINNLDNFIFMK